MMLRRSGTLIDTISSASNRAGIPSSVSATSNAWDNKRERLRITVLCICCCCFFCTYTLLSQHISHVVVISVIQSISSASSEFSFSCISALFGFCIDFIMLCAFHSRTKGHLSAKVKMFSTAPIRQVSSLALIMTASDCCVSGAGLVVT